MKQLYDEDTFQLNETIIKGTRDNFQYIKVNNHMYGKTYTYFKPLHRLEGGKKFTFFTINVNSTYNFIVHDPKFFLWSTRDSLFPGIKENYRVNKKIFDSKVSIDI